MKVLPTVLVADDDTQFKDNLARAFKGEGFSVRRARSAEQAIRTVSRDGVDAVVMDVIFGDAGQHSSLKRKRPEAMTGLEAIAKIQSEKPGIATFMVTAYKDKRTAFDDQARELALHIEEWFYRPLEEATIVQRVGECPAVYRRVLGSMEAEHRRLRDKYALSGPARLGPVSWRKVLDSILRHLSESADGYSEEVQRTRSFSRAKSEADKLWESIKTAGQNRRYLATILLAALRPMTSLTCSKEDIISLCAVAKTLSKAEVQQRDVIESLEILADGDIEVLPDLAHLGDQPTALYEEPLNSDE